MSTSPTAKTYSSLTEISIGQQAMLCKNTMDRGLEKKLLALGFSMLMPLRVTQKRTGGLVVGIGNARIALNQTLAQKIMIEAI
jgi:Fe2+ transport system protein FeoA